MDSGAGGLLLDKDPTMTEKEPSGAQEENPEKATGRRKRAAVLKNARRSRRRKIRQRPLDTAMTYYQTLGCGSIAQAVLSRWILGQIITINAGFSAAVALGVYVSGGVSGGHINPAVSFTMCFFGRMKWFKLPFYVAAQFVGAFLGAAALFGAYHDALMDFAGGQLITSGENATAHIFATYPVSYLSVPNAFAEQVLSSMFLHLIVFAIFDDKNLRVPKGLEPFAIFMLILVLTCALGMNGAAMNPARDLGPRVFTALAGWGFEVFTAGNHFWWIPVLGPVVGGILGGFIYIYGIEIHHAHPAPGQRLQKVDEKHELSVMM